MTDKLLHKPDFDPHLNTNFQVHTDTLGVVDMELFEVSEDKYPGQESFTVIFKAPKEKVFHQKIYKMTHQEMGEIELFLTPISYGKPDAMYYQSVFSRLLDE